METMLDLIHTENPLVLSLLLTPYERRELGKLFDFYYDSLWDAVLNLSVKYLISGPIKSAYRSTLRYLQETNPNHGFGKITKSIAFRASVTYPEFVKKIKSAARKNPKRVPRDRFKKAQYYHDIAVSIKAKEFDNNDLQFMMFKIQEPSETQVRLPFRCRLKGRMITPFDGYAWKCPDLKVDYLIRHAETLASDLEPGAAFLCQTLDKRGRYNYEFRLAFRSIQKGNGGIDLRRSYLGTLKLIKLQLIKNRRKGW